MHCFCRGNVSIDTEMWLCWLCIRFLWLARCERRVRVCIFQSKFYNLLQIFWIFCVWSKFNLSIASVWLLFCTWKCASCFCTWKWNICTFQNIDSTIHITLNTLKTWMDVHPRGVQQVAHTARCMEILFYSSFRSLFPRLQPMQLCICNCIYISCHSMHAHFFQ